MTEPPRAPLIRWADRYAGVMTAFCSALLIASFATLYANSIDLAELKARADAYRGGYDQLSTRIESGLADVATRVGGLETRLLAIEQGGRRPQGDR